MKNTRIFLASLCFLSAAWAEQLSIVKLPSYLKLEQHDQQLNGQDLSALVKGMSGMLPSGEASSHFEVTMSSGLRAPKLFVFLRLTGYPLPLSQISNEFPTFTMQQSGPFNLKGLFGDIGRFFGKSANLLEIDDSKNSEETIFDPNDVIELIKAVNPTDQQGPLFLSTQRFTAATGIDNLLNTFSEKLGSQFGDDYVIFVLFTPMELNERTRRAVVQDLPASKIPTPADINVGKDYSENYPVIFNIILWFMIGMSITIASVAYCIWFMDPGKDGIIYRMTASRIKKDL